MISRTISTAIIIALLFLYYYSDHPSRDVLLVSAIIVAIGDAAERICGASK